MEKYNHKAYDFFAKWHYNSKTEDIFNYRGIDIASAFRIEIWNDITFYVRVLINLYELFKGIECEKTYVGIDNKTTKQIVGFLNIKAVSWPAPENVSKPEYYFPIFRWMSEALHPVNIKRKIVVFAIALTDKILSFADKFKCRGKKDRHVYIEWYHPTKDIIQELKESKDIIMIRSDFNGIKDMFHGLHLPVFISSGSPKHNLIAENMLEKFKKEKCASLFVDSIDIGSELYKVIIKRVTPLIAKSLMMIDAIIGFFEKRRLNLMVTIASIGLVNRLMINYCEKNNIPVYMIINGYLGFSFLNEAKDGTWINSYGESMKRNYFKGMENVICLGDPRMDKYAKCLKKREINYKNPTIGIGASGFSNIDLNSYLAIEFEFINDIMQVCEKLIKSGNNMDIIIKVRKNGYIEQYKDFICEYYPELPVILEDSVPIEEVYEKADFFISIYSQTLFEAACYGLPVLYYKNDTQYLDPPFDGKSELITAVTPEDLMQKIEAFYNADMMYDEFKEKRILEKYIGPLDGENLKRNMDFIYSKFN